MKQKSFFCPLKLRFLGAVLLALFFSGCGTNWRIEYDSPQYGKAAVQFALPKKEGYAK